MKAEMCCSVLCSTLWTDQEAFSSDGPSLICRLLCAAPASPRGFRGRGEPLLVGRDKVPVACLE